MSQQKPNLFETEEENPKTIIYTDGSFECVTGTYGSAFVAFENGTEVARGSAAGRNAVWSQDWNVTGECFAGILALNWAEENGRMNVLIRHDLGFIGYIGEKSLRKSKCGARRLWMRRCAVFIGHGGRLEFEQVKGHSGIEGNEMADRLAGRAVAEYVMRNRPERMRYLSKRTDDYVTALLERDGYPEFKA